MGSGLELRDLPPVVPVFPLPQTVFFPHTALPLHVFEPRYRAMVRDARDGDGLISVALTTELDQFHSIGTVGRIEELEPLEDGRFNLRLRGLTRVALTEVPSDRPYRLARVEPRPEIECDVTGDETQRAKVELLALLGYLRRELNENAPQSIVLDETMPFGAAVNSVCAGLPVPAAVRQSLLEEDDIVQRQRQVGAAMNAVLELVLRRKPASPEPIN